MVPEFPALLKMSNKTDRLNDFTTRLAQFAIRWRWLVIIISLAGVVFLSTGMGKLVFSSNYRAFFSQDNPELQFFEEFQATYSKRDSLLFVFVPKNGSDIFTNENLAAIGEVTEKAWMLPFSARVDSVTNFQYTYADGDELIVEDLVPKPGESSPDDLVKRRAAALHEPLLKGRLITNDGRVSAVSASLRFPELSRSEVPKAVRAARALIAETTSAHPQFEIYLTGSTMLNHAFSEAVRTDIRTLIPLMVIVILITMTIAVRSVFITLTTLALVIMSGMVAMGVAGFIGVELAGPSPTAIIVILTLAIADAMHIIITMRTAMRAGEEKLAAIIESIRINFLAIAVTSLTTIVGFLTLNFSDAPPFRDFGNISAIGIFAAWILSITFLPAVFSLLPLRIHAIATGAQKSMMRRLADFVIANNRKLLWGSAALSVVLIGLIPRIEFNDAFFNYFDTRTQFREETDEIKKYFGLYTVDFSFKSGEPGGITDPAYLKKLDSFADWLRSQSNVTHVDSVADVMKRLNKNLHEDDQAFYSLPEDRQLAAQYLLLYELSTPLGLDLNDRITVDKSATRVTASLNGDISTSQFRKLLSNADDWISENAPEFEGPATGSFVMFAFIAQRNIESMISGTSIAIVAIVLVMMVTLRSASMGLWSIVPNGLPVLTAFGVWAVLVGEVGFSVASIASLSLGIVVDDTVHFLTKYKHARQKKGLNKREAIAYVFETVGLAIIMNTIILMAGFFVLTFSTFKINQELGMLTTITIGLALVFDFLLLPGLLLFSRTRPC